MTNLQNINLMHLSNDILVNIFLDFDFRELKSFFLINKRINQLLENNDFWYLKMRNDFPYRISDFENSKEIDWQEVYSKIYKQEEERMTADERKLLSSVVRNKIKLEKLLTQVDLQKFTPFLFLELFKWINRNKKLEKFNDYLNEIYKNIENSENVKQDYLIKCAIILQQPSEIIILLLDKFLLANDIPNSIEILNLLIIRNTLELNDLSKKIFDKIIENFKTAAKINEIYKLIKLSIRARNIVFLDFVINLKLLHRAIDLIRYQKDLRTLKAFYYLMILAIRTGDIEVLECVLKFMERINEINYVYKEVIKLRSSNGKNIIIFKNYNALSIGCAETSAEIIDLLIKYQACINLSVKEKFSLNHEMSMLIYYNCYYFEVVAPAVVAALKGHADIVELLIKKSDLNVILSDYKFNNEFIFSFDILSASILGGHSQLAKSILEYLMQNKVCQFEVIMTSIHRALQIDNYRDADFKVNYILSKRQARNYRMHRDPEITGLLVEQLLLMLSMKSSAAQKTSLRENIKYKIFPLNKQLNYEQAQLNLASALLNILNAKEDCSKTLSELFEKNKYIFNHKPMFKDIYTALNFLIHMHKQENKNDDEQSKLSEQPQMVSRSSFWTKISRYLAGDLKASSSSQTTNLPDNGNQPGKK